ncbi:MAG: threonine synthase [Armatimonadetes bacterium]|nr:threonine synthase [Armatimonadota bacterium]
MSCVRGLRCKECGRDYPIAAVYVCEFCFGPLEVQYNYEQAAQSMTRDAIAARPRNLWRYRELLPLDGEPTDGLQSGFTPFIRAHNLARELGVRDLYIKNDGVNFPTLSYKDRVVPVAIAKAKELGFDTVGCASTGNLANAVAAHGARAGLRRYIFIPTGLEAGKVMGTLVYQPTLVAVEGNYDDVNRLCSEITNKYHWAFVNVNMRPYYTEGAKTYGFEVGEQLGWRAPDNLVCPVAGGTILPKIWKSFHELERLGLIPSVRTRMFAAQAATCAPVVTAVHRGSDIIPPMKPAPLAESVDTSLRIGNPADGPYVVQAVRQSDGWAEMATNEEIIAAMQLLARTEGIWTETAGGTTLAVAKKLIEQGRIRRDETTVICITGNGLKTLEAVRERLGKPIPIAATLAAFEERVLGA